ncbi:MAG: hypothetical protein GFH27_549293n238 [Chloroflexi bacterium AL-W]|nr:hypothetical protein [Chloroflexi bacterium AL-N1]NOK67647.1 hypothetical protein [Chloroflexi bacterium AL-N10]NOK75583.1 hypothetical protein [Chloroflexi bacterium AL-N5]NOK82371.1 hypothetical protein [Chloroflexi bacterium AL-W]NOK90216.1 hypothetical protein [Chloroflexi bacterium AL-N15]
MSVPIRELKRRYKMNLALGHVLPTFDRSIPLPLSTGTPLYDAALTDKLVATTTLNEPEHLNRAWHLVQQATPEEQQTLVGHARYLLNDYKLLLALRAWQDGNDDMTRQLLRMLPWGWRFSFPTAVIKPAATIFTGWRRSLNFRLVSEPRFSALQSLFRDILTQAPSVAILKYRQTIKESAALLRFRFEGERERVIHNLCFHNGRDIAENDVVEPVGTFLRARRVVVDDDVVGLLSVLNDSEVEIPITSYMGLLGQLGIRLNQDLHSEIGPLRDYAVRCATAIESLLRLKEWGDWLTETHAQTLATRVHHSVIDKGIDIPFFKITKAFMNAPQHARQLVLEPLYIPLLEHFGRQTAGLLPGPGPLTFVQPGNVIHLMSFLLYTLLSSAMDTRLVLLYKKGVEEVPSLDLHNVARHLADDQRALESWLLAEFGGLTMRYEYTYDYKAVSRTLAKLNPTAPLMLDLPFADNMDILSALLPFERVFNLNTAFGAPGEICIAYEYYALFTMNTPNWNFGIWSRYSDSAAQRFGEFLDRLRAFQSLAESSSGGAA